MVKQQKKEISKNKKTKKKHRKRILILKFILTIIMLLVIFIGGFVAYSTVKNGWGVSGMIKTVIGHDRETVKDLKEFRVLLLGVSTDISVKLTDTIMVASYNPQTQQASLMSIPRDTFVGKNESTATSYHKINAVYQRGIDEILDTVNEITGLDIQYYIVIDTEALKKLVDNVLEGVEFDVPIDMDYDDPTQDLHIHLKAGMQTLDGESAEGLVRFRHNNNGTSYPVEYGDNDTGRMKTQRAFITEVINQTISLKNITKIGEILNIAYEYVDTNILLSDAKDYIPYVIEFNTDNLKTGTLPGVNETINGLWFYKYDKEESEEVIKELFNIQEEIESDETIQENQTNSNTSNTSNTSNKSENSKIKIEIINGSGNSSTLNAINTLLKNEGYTITKNTTIDSTKTTSIINNSGVSQTAEDVKELLGKGIILNSANSSSDADITIIIGTNYNE